MVNHLNFIIPELLFILNYIILIVYYGLYTISNKYRYLLSYKQITIFPAIILLIVSILELNYPFFTHYMFNQLLYINEYINIIKFVTNFATAIIIISSYTYIQAAKLNNFETYLLILSSQIGVVTLLMSNNIILLYLSLELITITVYILVAMNKINNYSIESGLKYFIVGAVSSGLFLLGLSVLYGNTGIINLHDLYIYINSYGQLTLKTVGLIDFYFIIASLFLILSLLFKIYCAPFHLWISDIYQGSPKHVLGYISIVPSLVYTIILIKFLEIFNELYPISYIILFFAIITIISGSVGALLQRKMKRLLAYSSITHVGYFLIAISIYLFNNIFGLVTFFYYYFIYISNLTLLFTHLIQNNSYINKSTIIEMDQINDYRGYFKLNSLYIFIFTVVLFSIAGIPPFVGFFGKLYILMSMIITGCSLYLQIFFILMAVVSCYYYLNIIKNIYFNIPRNYHYINYNIFNNIIMMVIAIGMICFILYMNTYSLIIYNIVLNYIS